MAVAYEYASATYGVALEGLPVPDEEALNAVAADGWEPVLMTSVHNGFAVMILFRRELGHLAPRRPTAKSSPAKSAPAKAAPAKSSPAKASGATRAARKAPAKAASAKRPSR